MPKISLSKLLPKLKTVAPQSNLPKFRITPVSGVVTGVVLDQYMVDQAQVIITKEGGRGKYIVIEPSLTEEEEEVYSLIMESLYYSLRPVAEITDPMKYIEQYIWSTAEELGILNEVQKAFPKYRYYIARDAIGYGKVNVPMNDPNIEEVSCEGYGRPVAVMHRKFSGFDWMDTNIVFNSEDELRLFVQRLTQKMGKSVTTARPAIDLVDSEGNRIAVTFSNEVSLPGSSFDVRRFLPDPLTITHMLDQGVLTPLMGAYYWLLIENRAFILVTGVMGSGKTTLINVFGSLIPPNMKIITVEETPELRLPQTHWQRFKTRPGEGEFSIDLFALVKHALRYMPNYIIVGEVRGEEANTLIQAAGVGTGAITSFHADSPEAALVRLRAPPMNIAEGGISLISNILTITRLKSESGLTIRRIVRDAEIVPPENRPVDVFTYDRRSDTYAPDDARTLVKNSYRLQALKPRLGMTEDEIAEELEKRANFLVSLLKEKKFAYSEVAPALMNYYAGENE
jgi:flagellar protein FlaI